MIPDAPNTVYLCAFDMQKYVAYVPLFEQVLGVEEKKVLARHAHPRHIVSFILGHGLVHQALGLALDRAPKDIVLSRDVSGKWFVADQPWHFNLSHSNHWLCLAMSTAGHVGVDIECLGKKRAWEKVANKYFSPAEQVTFCNITPNEQPEYAASRWVYREAWLKAHGLGVGAMHQVVLDDLSVGYHTTSIDDQILMNVVVRSQRKLSYQWVQPTVFIGAKN